MVTTMSEQTTGNHVWAALGDGRVAGYLKGSDGTWRLLSLLVYRPTSERMRDSGLADLTRVVDVRTVAGKAPRSRKPGQRVFLAHQAGDGTGVGALAWWGPAPPTEQEVADAIAAHEEAKSNGVPVKWGPDTVPTKANLTRRAGETPDEFYGRIASVWVRLELEGSRHPAKDMTEISGVKSGTMAKWVHEARRRGHFGGVR